MVYMTHDISSWSSVSRWTSFTRFTLFKRIKNNYTDIIEKNAHTHMYMYMLTFIVIIN